jgi:hypothetical protein
VIELIYLKYQLPKTKPINNSKTNRLITQTAQSLLRSCCSLAWSWNVPPFTEHESSLPYSQVVRHCNSSGVCRSRCSILHHRYIKTLNICHFTYKYVSQIISFLTFETEIRDACHFQHVGCVKLPSQSSVFNRSKECYREREIAELLSVQFSQSFRYFPSLIHVQTNLRNKSIKPRDAWIVEWSLISKWWCKASVFIYLCG